MFIFVYYNIEKERMLMSEEQLMRRCLELALNGAGRVAPNPMVGAVIVHNGRIIGEGYHEKYGAPHAEVMAINSVTDKSVLKESTLYVNLEPCCHYGKTPPCTQLILECGIPKVIIAATDPNPNVNCGGVESLKNYGVEIITGVLEREARELNRFFYTYFKKKRPFIIVKWAESADGFIDRKRFENETPEKISNEISNMLVHKWRTQVQSIMVGTNTVLFDNPLLTARKWSGKNPVRVVIDRYGKIPINSNIFNNNTETLLFITQHNQQPQQNIAGHTILIPTEVENTEEFILHELYNRKIQSLFIEGGAQLINNFIKKSLWDEARIFISTNSLDDGIKAPSKPKQKPRYLSGINSDKLFVYRENN